MSNLTYFDNPDLVWVVDMAHQFNCPKFFKLVVGVAAERFKKGYPTQWPIFLVDMRDRSYWLRCPKVEKLLGSDFVKWATIQVGLGDSMCGVTKDTSAQARRFVKAVLDTLLPVSPRLPGFIFDFYSWQTLRLSRT